MISNKKYVLYAQIKPYDLKLSFVFPTEAKVRYMQEFIEDTMRNLKTRFKIGRIEQKKTSSILLPDFKIGDVLENKDEIIAYSVEYGLTKKTLSDNEEIEDIDKLFIGKKTKKDPRIKSRKESGDKKVVKKKESKEKAKEKKEKSEEEDDEKAVKKKKSKDKDDDNDDEDEDDDGSKSSEKNKKKKSRKNSKSKSKKKEEDDDDDKENSSESGEDKSQDINL